VQILELREQTIESKEVFCGRLLKLRVDTVKLPDGNESAREIVVHGGAVAIVPLTQTGNVILVRQYRQAAGEVLLEIPAGTIEPGEEPIECARREIQEEIGYKAEELTPMFQSYLAPGYSTEILHAFLARGLSKASAPKDADEFIEVVEMPIDEAVRLIETGEIKDSKTISGILMALRVRF